jgi:peroxiredoxin
MPFRQLIGLAGGLLLVAGVATAVPPADWVPPGPVVGAKFSNSLQLSDQTGRRRALDELMGSQGITIVFVRSADWCPFCKRQLAELNQHAAEFEALGYPLVSVSVDAVPEITAFHDQARIHFTMLADPVGAAGEDLGIRDRQYPTGDRAFGVPHPGIFVLASDRTILAKFFEPGYKTRPDPNAVLESIRGLPSK